MGFSPTTISYAYPLTDSLAGAFKRFHWGLTKDERPTVVFDKETCCKAPTNALHNTWWAYVAPAYHPCVTGFGKTLQEALQSLYDQLQLGPEKYTALYDARPQRSIIANGTNLDTTMLGVTMATFNPSFSSGPGSHTPVPVVPSSLQTRGLRPISRSIISDRAKQTVQLSQSLASQNRSQKDKKIISNTSSTPATHLTMQMPDSGLDGGINTANASLDQLMEGMKSLQKGLETMSYHLRTPHLQSIQ